MKNLIYILLIVSVLGISAFLILRKQYPQTAPAPIQPIENEPISEFQTYSEFADTIPRRKTNDIGMRIRAISFDTYIELRADSCNFRPAKDPAKFRAAKDSLTLFTRNRAIVMLNYPYEEGDFFAEWEYDGYDTRKGLHFFNYSGYEAWGYYIASDHTGDISRFESNHIPVLCAKSDLFAAIYEDPYDSRYALFIYKLRPDGRVVKTAWSDRDPQGEYYSVDLTIPDWVGPHSLVSTLRNEEQVTGYVRIDIEPEALQNDTPEPLPEWGPENCNELVRTLRQ